ncbi:putative phosphoenolpyruvate phosphomutase [Talaromyces proteolyticus]|uniref:Phosphoenolpyruvate phosphomutase n=1 Tax=Talaromyces proteolyticus TaxID=1131652 RepID=A0AAD4KZB1_9EURO|nr:putative phosphoenolpyruvate phosphomutase [Talaromyces proteolyticus]KAH8702302.1 putative phosphoenolpyruvate phosphomutase [Talaromyces proteolyticus]
MSASIRSLLAQEKGRIRLLEAHDELSREIVRNGIGDDGQTFHGTWISGLTQTTYLGIPDTELISPLERAALITRTQSPPTNTRPLCTVYDADSGGKRDDIPALVESLAKQGVSMIIIEDKAAFEPGKKVNSLKETSGLQAQADMYEFAQTIRAFSTAAANFDMMITARIETFTVRTIKDDEAEEKESLKEALRDALRRAAVYRSARADAIMIHSKSPSPDEVLSFLAGYRANDPITPLVIVPTTYAKTSEDAFYNAGANVIIYANHLMRAKISAVSKFSEQFLAERPALFAQDKDLNNCVQVQNYGCLLQRLLGKKNLDEAVKWYRILAEAYAIENMARVVKCLLNGKRCSEADNAIVESYRGIWNLLKMLLAGLPNEIE